ncbi:acyl-CoA reductase [Mariniflexile ostreae]|uniref:Acyl-CoA reductase n=1 Tax=Mariniflexile ostreae TaxID=1520892 RepID=A0ABV5F877_9FLAO
MDLQQRITAFSNLGTFLGQFSNQIIEKKENILHNDFFFDGFKHQLKLAQENNNWFTQENILFAIEGWHKLLTYENISTWLARYQMPEPNPKKIAIIMAGNIPLVGFHDFLSVLISGHYVIVKQASSDKHLLPFLAKYLEYVAPELKGRITFTEDKLETFDAVIATGSNNTARYFEYYFKNKPSIIRHNRNSVAVLTGHETHEELQGLAEDVFRYYGLGCRNVSKLYVPRDYNFNAFFEAMYHWHPIIDTAKYANNYDYNKAVYLMSEYDMLENGFLMIKEDRSFSSPIATVFYEYYNSENELKEVLAAEKHNIQCVVAKGFDDNEITFGNTQKPELWDYADGIDSISFLIKL